MLGYRNEHIDALSVEQARQAIATKAYRPGSDAYLKHAPNPLTGTPGIPEVARFSDEEVEKRNASRHESSGVVVTLDEYTQKCLEGKDPIDATLLDLQKRFPGNRFRAINPILPTVAGPQFQQVYDDRGQAVKVGDLMVGFMPEEVYDRAYRRPNLERSQMMAGQYTRNPADPQEGPLKPADERLVPLEGEGLQVQKNLNTF
jgi:hypothetical protein